MEGDGLPTELVEGLHAHDVARDDHEGGKRPTSRVVAHPSYHAAGA